jgi:hypothetical protein
MKRKEKTPLKQGEGLKTKRKRTGKGIGEEESHRFACT